MVDVCGVRPFHPFASASSKESLKRKNLSSVALHTRSPRSAARSNCRRRICRGDTSTGTYSELNSFYLLVDKPSVYGLPDNPFNPWLHMKGDYLRALVGGLAAVAVLLAVVLLLV